MRARGDSTWGRQRSSGLDYAFVGYSIRMYLALLGRLSPCIDWRTGAEDLTFSSLSRICWLKGWLNRQQFMMVCTLRTWHHSVGICKFRKPYRKQSRSDRNWAGVNIFPWSRWGLGNWSRILILWGFVLRGRSVIALLRVFSPHLWVNWSS